MKFCVWGPDISQTRPRQIQDKSGATSVLSAPQILLWGASPEKPPVRFDNFAFEAQTLPRHFPDKSQTSLVGPYQCLRKKPQPRKPPGDPNLRNHILRLSPGQFPDNSKTIPRQVWCQAALSGPETMPWGTQRRPLRMIHNGHKMSTAPRSGQKTFPNYKQ